MSEVKLTEEARREFGAEVAPGWDPRLHAQRLAEAIDEDALAKALTGRPSFDRGRAEAAVRMLLEAVGEDPDREGLRETPRRVARYWAEVLTPRPFKMTVFPTESAEGMVVVGGVPFDSHCEHHMVPFRGEATVGYLPRAGIVGLSKLARVVQLYAARLQVQERLTAQVADHLVRELDPLGVGVRVRARHLCMECRGPRVPGAWTVTQALRGVLLTDAAARAEFLALAGRPAE